MFLNWHISPYKKLSIYAKDVLKSEPKQIILYIGDSKLLTEHHDVKWIWCKCSIKPENVEKQQDYIR